MLYSTTWLLKFFFSKLIYFFFHFWDIIDIQKHKIKVYRIMLWLIYTIKWLPQVLYISITSFRYKRRKCFLLVMRILYIYPLKKFNIEHCCSVAKSCLTLWDPMYCSPPGLLVLHYLSKFAQVHVHWVSDAIQPSHPLMRYIIHTAVLISFTILHITPLVITYLITGSLYLLANFIQFPLSQHFHPASGEHKPNLFFWGCYLFLKYNWHTTLC